MDVMSLKGYKKKGKPALWMTAFPPNMGNTISHVKPPTKKQLPHLNAVKKVIRKALWTQVPAAANKLEQAAQTIAAKKKAKAVIKKFWNSKKPYLGGLAPGEKAFFK